MLGDVNGLRYSFVVPIYRDAALAADFCTSFHEAFRSRLGVDEIADDVELIFVNDDGTRETTVELMAVCDRFSFAKVIELNRNFGQHIALSCGYRYASRRARRDAQRRPGGPALGDPEADRRRSNRRDAEMAICLRTSGGRPAGRRWTSRIFNWALNKATGDDLPLNLGTLRVMKRAAVDRLNDLPERSRFLPGLESWFGFRTRLRRDDPAAANRRAAPATAPRAACGWRSRRSSPSRIYRSGSSSCSAWWCPRIGFALALFLVISQLLFTDYQPGYPSTVAAVVFVGGVQIAVIGLASLYIGRILTEVQHRPLYVVRRTYKLETGAPPERQVIER